MSARPGPESGPVTDRPTGRLEATLPRAAYLTPEAFTQECERIFWRDQRDASGQVAEWPTGNIGKEKWLMVKSSSFRPHPEA